MSNTQSNMPIRILKTARRHDVIIGIDSLTLEEQELLVSLISQFHGWASHEPPPRPAFRGHWPHRRRRHPHGRHPDQHSKSTPPDDPNVPRKKKRRRRSKSGQRPNEGAIRNVA